MNNIFKKVLIVVAHPDDDVLGCGGIMAKYKNNKNTNFKIIFLGEGSSCRYKKELINSDKIKKIITERNVCAEKALSILGVSEYKFYNFPCGRLDQIDLIDLGKVIEAEIAEFLPDTIITHSEHDVNNDHKTVFQAVLQATRPGAKNFVKYLLCSEILSSSEWKFTNAFLPNIFIELSEADVNLKIDSLNEYVSEIKCFPFPRSEQGIKTLAAYRGMQLARYHAEAFRLVRGLVE